MPTYGDVVPMEYKTPDVRTPNQKRLDTIIDQNKLILAQLTEFNRNLGIVAKALLVISEQQGSKKLKKAVDKA